MLAIRMQRTGRKGHAQFRVIVQDSRRTPTSGRIVAALGHYDPHTKTAKLEKDKAAFYLEHGAQPSDRVAKLLEKEGVKLPKWVKLESGRNKSIRNQEKLRRNRPEEPAAPAAESTEEQPADEATELPAEVEKTEEAVADVEVAEAADQPEAEPDSKEEEKEA